LDSVATVITITATFAFCLTNPFSTDYFMLYQVAHRSSIGIADVNSFTGKIPFSYKNISVTARKE